MLDDRCEGDDWLGIRYQSACCMLPQGKILFSRWPFDIGSSQPSFFNDSFAGYSAKLGFDASFPFDLRPCLGISLDRRTICHLLAMGIIGRIYSRMNVLAKYVLRTPRPIAKGRTSKLLRRSKRNRERSDSNGGGDGSGGDGSNDDGSGGDGSGGGGAGGECSQKTTRYKTSTKRFCNEQSCSEGYDERINKRTSLWNLGNIWLFKMESHDL